MKRTKEILVSILLLTFFVYFFWIATQTGQTAGSDLLNYWKLNEGAGTTAYDDVGAKDGILYNSPTWKTEGFCKLGKCLGFDGFDDYIGIGGGFGTLVSNSSYTVSLWAKTQSTTKRQVIIGDWHSAGVSESFTIEFGGYPEATFSGRITTNHSDGSYDYLDSGVVYTIDTWYHIAVSWDQASGVRKIYVNGEYKNEDTQSSLENGVSVSLARAGAVSSAYLLGDIDDVRVYSRALTEAEIETLFQADLISHWSMDEGADTESTCNADLTSVYDYIGSNNGTLNLGGSPVPSVAWIDGKYSCALDFDGSNDYVDIGDKSDLDFVDSFSISAWIKTTQTSGQYPSIAGKGHLQAGVNGYGLFLNSDDSYDIYFQARNSDIICQADGGSVNDGEWHLITGVRDHSENTSKIYVDGILKGTATATLSSGYSSAAYFGIGRRHSPSLGWQFPFDGVIDDVRVYSRALTAGEVAVLAGGSIEEYCISGDSSPCDVPQVHWKMEEGAGQYVYNIPGDSFENYGLLGGSSAPGTNDPEWQTASECHDGSCLKFDGANDRVTSAIIENGIAKNARSFSAWIKPSSLSDKGVACIANDSDYAYSTCYFAFILQDSTTGTGGGRVFHNGKLLDTNSLNYVQIAASDDITIGGNIGQVDVAGWYNGWIDDVRFYDYRRTDEQMALDYGQGRATAYWKMDEGAGITVFDDTGTYDGTLVNGAAWLPSSSCRIDGCLYFDSNDDAVEVDGEPVGAGADSLCAWIYPISGGTDPYPRIMDNGRMIFYVQSGDEIAFTSDTNTYLQTTTDVVNYDTWQHVCAVRDASGNAKIYIDGVEKASGPSGAPTAGTVDLSVGNRADYGRTFYGRIDDVRIYEGVLDEDTIQTLASMGEEEPPPEEILTNVFGWGWNDAFGWTSFNCANCEANPSCDKTAACNGTHPNYGVFIDEATGIMSGYAWSEGVGWISFNESELSGCPVLPCWAFIDLDNGQVSGWAKVLSGFWLRLRDTDYGVYLDSSSEFRGHAWSDEFGWLSFNHLNCDSNSDDSSDTGNYSNCPVGQSVSDYMVWTSISIDLPPSSPPTAVGLNVGEVGYCETPQQFFSWTFQDPDVGDTQSAYHIQVDKEGDWIAGAGELDSGKVYSSSPSRSVVVAQYAGADQLEYNQSYFWRLKVWDSNEMASDWVYGASFTTPTHIYPTPGFDWTPTYPASGEVVQFCAVNDGVNCFEENSACYGSDNNVIPCSGKIFLWTFPAGTEFETGSTAASENPQVKLNEENAEVTLEITDDMGTCGFTDTINITLPFPEWEETTPK